MDESISYSSLPSSSASSGSSSETVLTLGEMETGEGRDSEAEDDLLDGSPGIVPLLLGLTFALVAWRRSSEFKSGRSENFQCRGPHRRA